MRQLNHQDANTTNLQAIVKSGLCIGCGICEALSDGSIAMQATKGGSLRPTPLPSPASKLNRKLSRVCPGVQVEPRYAGLAAPASDVVWGPYFSSFTAWASDPQVRLKAATGGVLTTLAMYLIDSGQIDFVLHVSADPKHPMRNIWVISETAEEVFARCLV